VVIEAEFNGRLHDAKIGRDVEVARHIERVMPDMQDLAAFFLALHEFDPRQDRIADGLERLRDQAGTDHLRRHARAEGEHAAAEAGRDWCGHQIPHEVDDVLHVIFDAEPLDHVGHDALALFLVQADGTADAGMKCRIFRKRRGHDPLAQVGLDQHMRAAVGGALVEARSDIECGMRPGRLREVFDDAGDAGIAFHQQDVARLQHGFERSGIACRKGLDPGEVCSRYLISWRLTQLCVRSVIPSSPPGFPGLVQLYPPNRLSEFYFIAVHNGARKSSSGGSIGG
jgi:hypothetical protein